MQPSARNQVVPTQGEKQKVGSEEKSGERAKEVVTQNAANAWRQPSRVARIGNIESGQQNEPLMG